MTLNAVYETLFTGVFQVYIPYTSRFSAKDRYKEVLLYHENVYLAS